MTVKYNPLLKMEYGKRLNPEHSLRTPKGIKGTRQKVIVTHNPSEVDQAQELLVRFPNLGSDDVIIPGMANLSFNIELSSSVDANRTLVSNIGRAIVKKLAVKFEGNEIMSVDDFDMFACYRDLWKTKSEKRNAIQQGIISTDGCTENCLDFEMLDSAAPYYQACLGNYVTSSLSMITTELSNPEYHHQKFQMQSIRSRTYPQNMRSLLNLTLRDLSGLNTSIWPCYMTEFSDIEKL